MSKSTYDRGLQAELAVIQLLESKKYKILAHRFRTPFAEVDIFARGQQGQIVIIEVKKRSGQLNDQPVISAFQKRRLRKVLIWFSEFGYSAELWLAVVNSKQKISFFRDVFD